MSNSTIFITGATGFIGSQVVLDTLKAGYRARLSVRREAQIEELKTVFAGYDSQLEFFVIPDISKREAIQSALAGVTYVFHIASPMPGAGEDFKTEYLYPAVNGTEAVLEAAAAVQTIKRVVIMSSLLALMPLGSTNTPGQYITEGADVSEGVTPDIDLPSGPAGYGLKYTASKILAHRATIAWMVQHKPQFKLITLHPSFVLGHDLVQKTAKPATVNAWVLGGIASGTPPILASFVNVRDVSLANLHAIDAPLNEGAPLTEVILGGSSTTWEAVGKFIKEKYPDVECKIEGTFPAPFVADGSRAERDFGIRWASAEETISQVLDQQALFKQRAGL
ncbi:hypothetical protein B0T17DRAFT_529663 [Bombardia bombarda]|uniref:NAD-dependent epimerase/dehydratase domain-containing protein n=1 Tax=Bombardia bombarda TaxID=252184 RepID=A0AA40CAA7_9PEZI|nr:hypothetical protein B0T17DRAFT_529663 [Bombardia bombarda]